MDTSQFEIKESIEIEGITADYVWYNAELLKNKMSMWQHDFSRVVNVMEARHKEHLSMLQKVMMENAQLKKQLTKEEK